MKLTTDTLIIAGMALCVIVLIGLIVSVWRGITARQALGNIQKNLADQEKELHTLVATNQQLVQESHQRDLKLGALDAEISNLRHRLQDRDGHITQLSGKQQNLNTSLEKIRDDLARSSADNRGQTVELEQASLQMREKLAELKSLKSELAALSARHSAVLNEHTELQTQLHEREDRYAEQIELLNETRENLKREFENLANKIFEDKGKSFTTTSKESLEAMLKPFREQISGFQSRINEVHSESVRGNTALEKEIQKVLDIGLEMNSQASNLAVALKGDKKTAGNWGEAQLERTLELAGLQAGDHYESQAAFRDEDGKRKLPDFVIKLPDNKNLVIDSKVSLVDYDRAIAAGTDEERTTALNAHAQAVRNHIDDLSSKDYANLPGIGSPDFVLMFMPIEPAYIEAMKHTRDLFNYGYKKGVIMVSHTTLMPILRTVANLWMIEQSNKEAREIGSRAGDIYNQVCLVAERLHKLGNTLKAANNHYNDTVKGLVGKQGLHGKVERFAQLSTKANKEMAALESIHDDIENDRLESVADIGEGGPDPTLLDSNDARQTRVKSIKVET
ncbi:MAG: DNA recombination protein RmuC [Gammaproteobacteria bacterium]|nr:MAG: DNA recombination protein RmuC [Gammaproteobacteria bacterium]RLA54039.1 MAG: DNA recombination protein RmuC [Gammaproteobacteria bacterium]